MINNFLPQTYFLADYCENYIQGVTDNWNHTPSEKIYDACCDYLMNTETKAQREMLRNFFKLTNYEN